MAKAKKKSKRAKAKRSRLIFEKASPTIEIVKLVVGLVRIVLDLWTMWNK
jgi:hypothetical protein